jgi:hypothetical protein
VTRVSPAAPLTYHIDSARSVVLLIYGEQQPTFDQWRSVMDELLRDPLFRPGLHLLSDRRRLCEASTTRMIENMSHYVAARRDRFGRGRWAIATGTPAEYGMVRMAEVLFETVGSHVTLRAFTNFDEAERWALVGCL